MYSQHGNCLLLSIVSVAIMGTMEMMGMSACTSFRRDQISFISLFKVLYSQKGGIPSLTTDMSGGYQEILLDRLNKNEKKILKFLNNVFIIEKPGTCGTGHFGF